MSKKALLLALFLLVPTVTSASDSRRDGNWWISLSPAVKLTYVVGFFDGMDLGHKFSYWGYSGPSEEHKKIRGSAISSYNYHMNKYMRNTTNDQVTDGLDEFYADYRNRRIMVSHAVWIISNEISGEPKDKIDAMTESWRRNTR